MKIKQNTLALTLIGVLLLFIFSNNATLASEKIKTLNTQQIQTLLHSMNQLQKYNNACMLEKPHSSYSWYKQKNIFNNTIPLTIKDVNQIDDILSTYQIDVSTLKNILNKSFFQSILDIVDKNPHIFMSNPFIAQDTPKEEPNPDNADKKWTPLICWDDSVISIPEDFDNDNLRHQDYEQIITWFEQVKEILPEQEYIKFLKSQSKSKEEYLSNAAFETLAKFNLQE